MGVCRYIVPADVQKRADDVVPFDGNGREPSYSRSFYGPHQESLHLVVHVVGNSNPVVLVFIYNVVESSITQFPGGMLDGEPIGRGMFFYIKMGSVKRQGKTLGQFLNKSLVPFRFCAPELMVDVGKADVEGQFLLISLRTKEERSGIDSPDMARSTLSPLQIRPFADYRFVDKVNDVHSRL